MPFFYKIKNYFFAYSKITQELIPRNNEGSHGIIQRLSTVECLEVAGGPQVRNETDIG